MLLIEEHEMSFGKGGGKPFGRRANVSDTVEPAAEKPPTPSPASQSTPTLPPPTESFRSRMAKLVVPEGAKAPVFVAEQLRQALELIKHDAQALALAVRNNDRHQGSLPAELIYWPIRWKNCEDLFARTDAAGVRQFTTFCFTPDLQNFNPLAQYELARFYVLVLDTNMLAHGQLTFGLPEDSLADLKSRIDGILVIATRFIQMLKSYLMAMKLMDGTRDSHMVADERQGQVSSQLIALHRIGAELFDREAATKYIPLMAPSFLVAFEEPFHEGQIVMNGVHYRRQLADLWRADATQRQAETEAMGQTRH